MSNLIKNSMRRFKNKGKEGALFLLLSVGVFVACQGALEDGTPFGPSTSTFKIIPTTAIVTTGDTLTFTPFGGTVPISWTSANTNIGTIVVNTGVFTAGATLGNVIVTALDAVGNVATASVTIPGLALVFDAVGATEDTVTADSVITAVANNSGAGFTTTIANDDTGSTYLLVPTIVTTGTTVTITSPDTLPALSTDGDQTFTVTVTDIFNTNTVTLAYSLQADPLT